MTFGRSANSEDPPTERRGWRERIGAERNSSRSQDDSDDPMSMTPKPSRRAAALATLAFAGAVGTGAAGGGAAAAAATPRSAPPVPRTANRAQAGDDSQRATTDAPALQLPSTDDLAGLAAELGVHPGRLQAALRKVAESGAGANGTDPLTALASELGLPATQVYLAAARQAAQQRAS